MTTTKIIYVIGTVMPCGVLLLAAFAIYKMITANKQAVAHIA